MINEITDKIAIELTKNIIKPDETIAGYGFLGVDAVFVELDNDKGMIKTLVFNRVEVEHARIMTGEK